MEHLNADRKQKFSEIILPTVGGAHEDRLIEGLDFEEYLADRTRMSSTGLRKLRKSPEHFHAWARGDFAEKDEDHFRYGRAVHLFLLEPQSFMDRYVIQPDFGDMRSSKNRERRDAWRGDLPTNAVVLTEEEHDSLLWIFENVSKHQQIGNMLKNGQPEMTGHWQHKGTGVNLKIRPDYVTEVDGALHVIDLKTTRTTGEALFRRVIEDYDYPLQLALYHDGVAQITGKKMDSPAIISIEKTPPYSVALWWIEPYLEKARERYSKALERFVECKTQDKWEPVQVAGQMIEPSVYYGLD